MGLEVNDLSKFGDLKKARRYQFIHYCFYFLNLALTGTLLAVLVWSPVGSWMRELAGFFEPGWTQVGFYFLLFSLFFFVFELPFGFVNGFIVEHRFGLSNHTLSSWALDELKRGLLSFGIALVLVEALYLALALRPQDWWWMAWLVYFAFTLFFTKIFPLWIVPMFYKYGPVDDVELKARISDLAAQNGLKVGEFYSLNLSRTTKKANAMFTGLGRTKRIVLGDTLLKDFSRDEITTVIAHEIGHFKHRHILKNVLTGAVFSCLLFWVVFLCLNTWASSAGRAVSDPIFLPAIAFLCWAVSLLSDPFFKAISRKHEREADRFALEATRDPGAFISAFQKLASTNLADPDPNPWIERLLYTHPAIARRVAAAEDFRTKIWGMGNRE